MANPAPGIRVIPTGPGKYNYRNNVDGDATVLLYNFDINGHRVKEDHQAILRSKVLEILKSGGSVAILGHASTTGTAKYDDGLSDERAQEVLKFLRSEGGSHFLVNLVDHRGKATALAMTGVNNKEDERWRAVWVRAWSKSTPPPDIGVPVNPGVPLPKDPLISQFNDDLSLVGGALSIVDLGIDIAGSYIGIAGLATAGIVTGVAGLALTIVGGIIGMPALWASVDALAEANGKMQGYADAMQDMAAGFSDDSLDRKPLRDWPAIPDPQPHILAPATSVSQQAWHRGQRRGCIQARIDILAAEGHPVETTVKMKDGSTRKAKVNGKVMLRAAWVSTKGEVSVAVIKKFNEQLEKAGKKPFPTR